MLKYKLLAGIILAIIAASLMSACGLLQAPEEASGPIEAIPLELATATAEPISTPSPAPSEATSADASAQDTSGGLLVFQINPGDSQVRFELDEDLRGQRITVVGTTDQIAGELAVDLADLSAAQVGTIQINARTLLTDNNFRNRAIQNEILDTGTYEFITFTPTSITGLSGSAGIGEQVIFSIQGNLTIRDITQPVIFNVVATANNQNQIQGSASTTINRNDFGLVIPSVRNVANVEEEVELYIDFTATQS